MAGRSSVSVSKATFKGDSRSRPRRRRVWRLPAWGTDGTVSTNPRAEDGGAAVSSTVGFASGHIAVGETPRQVVLDVPLRVIAKLLFSVFVFTVAVSLLASVRTVLIWVGLALFIAVALNPAVVQVERLMRRTWAVVTVFLAFVVGLLAVLALLVAPFVGQIDRIPESAPQAADRLAKNPLIHRLDEHYQIIDKLKAHASELPDIVFGAAGTVVNGVAATVTVLFLAAFVLFELPQINELILSQLRPRSADRAREIGGHINRTVGGYVAGNLLISVIAGVVAALTLWILDIPYALTLGVVVAIGDLVPLVGATIAMILVIAVAYFSGGTADGIIVFVVTMVYQQIENHLIQPAVYRRTVQMPALVVLIAVLAGAALLGILGALIAIPIAGTIQVVVKDLLRERAERITAQEPGAT
jgi:putative heme transporter